MITLLMYCAKEVVKSGRYWTKTYIRLTELDIITELNAAILGNLVSSP